MMVLGCDPHKRSITCGAVEALTGVARGFKTAAADLDGFDVLVGGRARSMTCGCGRLRTAGMCLGAWSGFWSRAASAWCGWRRS